MGFKQGAGLRLRTHEAGKYNVARIGSMAAEGVRLPSLEVRPLEWIQGWSVASSWPEGTSECGRSGLGPQQAPGGRVGRENAG